MEKIQLISFVLDLIKIEAIRGNFVRVEGEGKLNHGLLIVKTFEGFMQNKT